MGEAQRASTSTREEAFGSAAPYRAGFLHCLKPMFVPCPDVRPASAGVFSSASMNTRLSQLLALATLVSISAALSAQQAAKPKPEDTEVWTPVPNIVTPGATETAPPSDAIVLFDGKNQDEWVSAQDHTPARWVVSDGILTVTKAEGVGNIETKRKFKDYQLHVEFRIPANITGSGQARGNSGVFLASTGPGDDGYELQVLDSYNNTTYVNGQAASIYKQNAPLVNPNRKPGEWQTYDIVWTAPRFNDDGSVKTPANVTVLFNGVLVQNHFELKGQTLYIGKPFYKAYDRAPIKLQAHGDKSEPLSFRNIWVRDLN
jgi:3-keto-disaccharide hydrolase